MSWKKTKATLSLGKAKGQGQPKKFERGDVSDDDIDACK